MDGMAKWVVKCQITTSIHLRVVLAPGRLATLSSARDLDGGGGLPLMYLIVQFTEQDGDMTESLFVAITTR